MAVAQSAQKSATINQLIPFDFEEHAVRVILDEHGAPWFHVGDVCQVLDFGNPSQAVASHVDGDDLQKLEVIDSLGRTQQANHVSEFGLYALVVGSTKPEAKRFKRWVTHEVLPTIRKTGGYGKADCTNAASDRFIAGLLHAVQELKQVTQKLDRQNTPDTFAMSSRQELRLSHTRRALTFQQAIRPIHIEYEKIWTTTRAISEEGQVNHAYLMQLVESLLRAGMIQRKDHDRIHFFPDQACSAQQLHCLTEDGFHVLWQHIERTHTAEEKAKTNLRDGCERISRMFAFLNCAGGRRTRRVPTRDVGGLIASLDNVAAELANAVARGGRHG
ncbi:MAG: hypothetical protein HQL87_18765 [Magnetococcales bacterium]|nr:hypothetical protein [Magnetococcales bacterium]